MKPNSKTQSDQGLKFDGAELLSQNRSNKFRGNQHTGHSNDGREVQMTQAPNRRGNSNSGQTAGPSTATGTAQKRNPGGTRKWEPSATSNYNGNPDRINAGPGPRKGNSK